MSFLFHAARRLVRRPLSPQLFPTTGSKVIDPSSPIEEETWEWYTSDEFYPVKIGEVFKSQYQVVGKLGYGAYATVWLCRDLMKHRHVVLKIGTSEALSGELSVMKYLKTIRTKHVGASLVRQVLDEFPVINNNVKNHAVVYPPLAVTLREFRKMFPSKSLPVDLLRSVLKHILLALDFLHTEAKVIHTDIQEKNILLGLDDSSAQADLYNFETQEIEFPSPRKIVGSRIIYTSRPLVRRVYQYGRPVLCDLGEARFGKYNPLDDIQPYQYRAPEVILDISWDEKVDIWNVGTLIWDLFENDNLFKTRGGIENRDDNMYHLAHMVALIGPPPSNFLERSQTDRPWQWFHKDGSWKGVAKIPNTTLEDAEKVFQGETKAQFLQFVRNMLKWEPEERKNARELLKDRWLNAVD